MVRVQRANVVLRVEDHEVQHYMSLGYNVIDDNGTILKEAISNNVGVLQSQHLQDTRKIAELEEEVARLTAELQIKTARKRKQNTD